jgi:integrase
MFRWAVENELVPVTTYQALAAVAGLRKGRSAACEPVPVLPVAESAVESALPYMTAPVQAMVRVQWLTGCRPGEICSMRPIDIDRAGDVWCYVPRAHKTQHHGVERRICSVRSSAFCWASARGRPGFMPGRRCPTSVSQASLSSR